LNENAVWHLPQRAFMWLLGGPISVTAGPAGRLQIDLRRLPADHPHGFRLVRGVVEPSVQEALRRTVAAGMTVYDIGADVGFFTIRRSAVSGHSEPILRSNPL
jgi:hypothetical protein